MEHNPGLELELPCIARADEAREVISFARNAYDSGT